MKKLRKVIIIIVLLLILGGVTFGVFTLLNDQNKLTVEERNWINDNINTIQNINIVNNANVFGKNGSGVFYDFLKDFSKEYGLEINYITFNIGSNPSGISFGVKKEISDQDLVIYEDHYVLVSKNDEIIPSSDNLRGKTIGVLNGNTSYVSEYINSSNLTYKEYENIDSLKSSLDNETNYIALPLMEYLDVILASNYHIVYHISDMKVYYTMQKDDSILARVLNKYYANWLDNFNKYYNEEEFKTFTESLKISDTEVDSLQSVAYNYGFVNTSPYEVIMGGKYGGIIAVYLQKFSELTNIEFNFNKYRSFARFKKAVTSGDIDLYFNYYNNNDDYYKTNGIAIPYVISTKRDNNEVIMSLKSLNGKKVFVEENSLLYDYIKNVKNIKIETYENLKDFKKKTKKLKDEEYYLVIDEFIFDYQKDSILKDYNIRFEDNINKEYQFKVRTNSALYKLLNTYMEVVDSKEVINEGLNNHYETVKTGSFLSSIAEYIIYLVLIFIIVALLIIRKSKKIIIAKKIKKEDKLKFIDQLTSLKNRNFLNENISVWNNNTIYPQTIIVIDLNKIQEINDVEGYNEGDKQIKACANALIKTQLDNSEIMRTDGNEFVIYLVGYSQKQVTNYIHKLNKEIKKLPYDYGAEYGYSMILDDIKTIEDALNEAVDDMKKQKSDGSEKQSKK